MSLVFSIKLALLLTLVALSSVHSAPARAPAPVADCTNVVLSLSACFTYVSEGRTVLKPETDCCKGLKSVLMPDASATGVACLCDAFNNAQTEYGVQLNMTRAEDLPGACNVTFSVNASCLIGSPAPALAPVDSPLAISPSPSAPQTPSPSISGTPSTLVPGTPNSGVGEAPSAQAPSSPAGSSSSSSSSSFTTSGALLFLTATAVAFLT